QIGAHAHRGTKSLAGPLLRLRSILCPLVREQKTRKPPLTKPLLGSLMMIPSVGPVIASALRARVTDPKLFENGRHMSAWIGIVPENDSTGGKRRIQTTTASGSREAGQAVIYWSSDGTALYKTPSGPMMHGQWETNGNTLCPAWKERPNTGCIRFEKT